MLQNVLNLPLDLKYYYHYSVLKFMIKVLKKIFVIILRILLCFLIIFFSIILIQYLIAPVYKFPEIKVFSGDKIFNPYKDIDRTLWRKGNFQIQSYAWMGLTNGWKNSNNEIDSIYQYLGYDIIVTSDYMKINKHGIENESYIPVYEHGYSILKHHQVCIGSEKVNWKDYMFFQNIHHKQHILNSLREKNELVYIAHPKLKGAYSPEDFRFLTNYDGIEVLNNFRISTAHWDSALSTGHFATILSDDDAHDITNPDEIGHRCTFINTESLAADSVIKALKQGKAFGADIYRPLGENFEVKKQKIDEIATLKEVKVSADTLIVEVSNKAKEFRFIGQNGEIKKTVADTKCAKYKIKPEDTYIRTEIVFPNRNVFYLNPVFRYKGDKPEKTRLAEIDLYKTWLLRIIGFATIIFVIINIIYFRRRKKFGRQRK